MMHSIALSIFVSALITAIIRLVPVLCLAHYNFPSLLKHWLMFIPPAILTTIIASEVLHCQQISLFGLSVSFLAAISSFVIGAFCQNLFAAVVASIASYLVFQYFDLIISYL